MAIYILPPTKNISGETLSLTVDMFENVDVILTPRGKKVFAYALTADYVDHPGRYNGNYEHVRKIADEVLESDVYVETFSIARLLCVLGEYHEKGGYLFKDGILYLRVYGKIVKIYQEGDVIFSLSKAGETYFYEKSGKHPKLFETMSVREFISFFGKKELDNPQRFFVSGKITLLTHPKDIIDITQEGVQEEIQQAMH